MNIGSLQNLQGGSMSCIVEHLRLNWCNKYSRLLVLTAVIKILCLHLYFRLSRNDVG